MRSFSYNFPISLVAGTDSKSFFLNRIREFNIEKVVVLTGRNYSHSIYEYSIKNILQESSIEALCRPIDKPNLDSELREVYEEFWSNHLAPQALVSVGGGSIMDFTKALSVTISKKDKFKDWPNFDLLCQLLQKTPAEIPIICIPTTVGTGSESNGTFAIYDQTGRKQTLSNLTTRPLLAWLDSNHVKGLSYEAVKDGIWDCISHLLEQICKVEKDTSWSDRMLMGALEQLLCDLKNCGNWKTDHALRESVMLLSFWAMSYLFSMGKTIEWSLHKLSDEKNCGESHSKQIQNELKNWIKIQEKNPPFVDQELINRFKCILQEITKMQFR